MRQKGGIEQSILSFPLWDGFLNLVPFDYDGNLQLELCKEQLFTLISYEYQQQLTKEFGTVVSEYAAGVRQLFFSQNHFVNRLLRSK